MTTEIKPTPHFRRLADMSDQNLVLKPLVNAYLLQAKFPDRFDVTFHKAGVAREPDDWFHPSTHPLWTARQLYYYLTAPGNLEVEVLDYESRMAITMGTAVHGFIEMCIRDGGLMAPLVGICIACLRPHGTKKGQCDEYGAADPVLGRRGHMDGVLVIDATGTFWTPGIGVLEFKTTNPNAARGLQDNDIDAFKKKWPEYYAQVQEYLDLTGYTQAIVLIAVIGYPWKLLEFQITYDPMFAAVIKAKYELVREHVKLGVPPDACCGPKSKEAKACIARWTCPIGRM